MRFTTIIRVIYLTTLLASCQKERHHETAVYKTWRWEQSVGGFSGHDTITPPLNTIITLTFNHDLTYSTTVNGQPVSQGSFTLAQVNDQLILNAGTHSPAGGLFLSDNDLLVTTAGNRLQLKDHNVTEPYTHFFVEK